MLNMNEYVHDALSFTSDEMHTMIKDYLTIEVDYMFTP